MLAVIRGMSIREAMESMFYMKVHGDTDVRKSPALHINCAKIRKSQESSLDRCLVPRPNARSQVVSGQVIGKFMRRDGYLRVPIMDYPDLRELLCRTRMSRRYTRHRGLCLYSLMFTARSWTSRAKFLG